MKTLYLILGRRDRPAFRAKLRDEALTSTGGLDYADRATLLVADEPAGDADDPIYDAVLQSWHETDGPHPALVDTLAPDAEVTSMPVQERVRKDVYGWLPVGQSPGVALLAFFKPLDGMSRDETLRHWNQHVPLALPIHHGMNRYIQNAAAAGVGAGPGWFGMAQLQFPDAETVASGSYRTEADVATITDDIAAFISEFKTVMATEYVLKQAV